MIFGRLRYVNTHAMRLNLLVLMVVSLLPFPTRVMAEAIRDPSAERTAVIFYRLALTAVVRNRCAVGGGRGQQCGR